ncbi:hypothetical protein FNYG_15400 [Fusarium nygamai]|uniref:Allergen n=1 Tax=Gibberella nygamai TaxID=42673 RepID=A0A2K0UE13_GIBNY|nr:hypothetical protein FNYG_15400 [Fusarium nygamai]
MFVLTSMRAPAQHHYNLVPVEHKTFHHDKEADTRANLEREAARYRDTTETHSTTHSTETAPTVSGERIHHHVHEHLQPVIQKETVQPHVVHTTIPIHETHHAAPVHHGTSTLPVKTLEEFTHERGGLSEKAAQKLTEFEDCPKPYRRELQQEQLEGDRSMHLHGHDDNYGENQAYGGREGQGTGRNIEGLAAGVAATRKHRHGPGHKERRGSASSSSSSSSDEESRSLGKTHKNRGLGGAGIGSIEHPNTAGLNSSHTSGEYSQTKTGSLHNDPFNKAHARSDSDVNVQQAQKPSLIDRLNPLKDTDGDGKKGFME